MNVLLSLSLWLALMMSSSCDSTVGNTGSHEEELTTEYYDDSTETVTATPEYDYSATFDYYYVTGLYTPHERNKAAGIGPLSPVLFLGLAVHHIWN